ncbi:MAG: InlB B-repeat-containing protein, partial [Clostridia bacterium]|nr:InlB B-repeat-containing protein [Clostridia bacterium]
MEADIGRLRAGQKSSTWASESKLSSNMFAAYGYFTDGSIGNRVKCTYELVNTDENAPVNDLKVTGYTDSAGVPKAIFINNFTYGLKKEDVAIVAGKSVAINNKTISIYSVMGGGANTSLIANPAIILKLPKGMNFSNLKFTKTIVNSIDSTRNSTSTLEYTVDNITYMNTTEDGTNIYKITFKDRSLVAGSLVNEYLDSVDIKVSVTLGTAKNVTTQVYDLNDLINITSETPLQANRYDGNASPAVEDKYGINGGRTLAGVRRMDAGVTGISVQRLESITVDNAISVLKIDGKEVNPATRTWDTYDESNQNSISYIGMKTEGEYRIKIENPATSEAKNLKLIIPIPKEGVNLGSALTKGENEFNMELTPKDTQGYTCTYIKINEKVSENREFSGIDYEEAKKEDANAILVTKQTVSAGASNTLLFDFKVENDSSVQNGDFNCWRNNFEYQLDEHIEAGSGSYVAAEVATCTITGTAFIDTNGNNKKDDDEDYKELPLENLSVVAKDSLGRVQFAKTDENGNYKFENVREDEVTISMEIEEGAYIFKGKKEENNGQIYNNVTPNPENNKKAETTITASGEVVEVNAGVQKVYTITYDAGVGTGTPPAKQEVLENGTIVIATPPSGMVEKGSEFVGWATTKITTADNNREKVEYDAGDVLKVTEDLTLYAVYVKKDIKITFDYRGGGIYEDVEGEQTNVGIEYKYVKYGQKYNVADKDGKTFPQNPTKEGWKFIRWELSNSSYGTGTSIQGSTKVEIEEDMTLRALWYKLNRESDTINSKLLTTTTLEQPLLCIKKDLKVINMVNNYGYKFVLATGTVLPEGISFDGTTGSFYGTPTEEYDGTINVTVKAKYSSNAENYYDFPYTVNMKLSKSDISIETEADPAGAVTVKNNEGQVKIKSKINGLIEGFVPNNENKVTFKVTKQGAEVSTEIGTATIQEGIAEFDWNITGENTGIYKIEAEIKDLKEYYNITSNESTNPYSVSLAELEKYTITFDPNGYDIESQEKIYVEGTTYGNMPTPTIPGYTFLGWYDGQGETSNKIEGTESVNNNKTLYAHFEKREYKVNYDTKIDVEITALEKIDFDKKGLVPENELQRIGYTFKGWSLEGGKIITNNTKYSDLVVNDDVTEITLVANWEVNQYFVTYNTNGGSIETTQLRVTYNEKYGDNLAKPSKVGYDFIEWQDKDGNVVTKDTIYKIDENSTIYAQWQAKTGYAIKFATNGGTEVAERKNIDWETLAIEGITTPTKEGSTFLYWNYDGKKVLENQTFGDLAQNDKYVSITLNAVWDSNKYNVTLEEGTGYKLENIDRITESEYNSNYVFEVKLDSGYEKGPDFKVTVNDVEVELNTKNRYTITKIQENKTVKVSGVVDARYATGEISVGTDKWTNKETNVELKYYKDGLNVVITGEYNYGSKPKPKIQYAIVEDAIEYIDEKTLTWKDYDRGFTLSKEGKYIIYAKLTADNGASTYINTDVITIDLTAPEIVGITDEGKYCETKTISIIEETSGIKTVKANGVEISKNTQSVGSTEETYTLPTNGETTIVAVDNAGNETTIYAELNAEHKYNLDKTIEATCTEDGKKIYKCSICNHQKEEKIDKFGHNFGEWITTKEATEEEKGIEERKCTRCDEKEKRELPILSHTHKYSTEWTIDQEATCTETGEKSHYCKCGERMDITQIPALGHNWGEWKTTIEPTEEETGIEERECIRCKEKQENILPILSHTHKYSTEWIIDKEATCTVIGEKSHYCECGSRSDITEIPALGHDFGEWKTTKESTTKEEGLQTRTCKKCNYTEEEKIEKIKETSKKEEIITKDKEATIKETSSKEKEVINKKTNIKDEEKIIKETYTKDKETTIKETNTKDEEKIIKETYTKDKET